MFLLGEALGLIKKSLRLTGRGHKWSDGSMADLLYVIQDHYYDEPPRIGELLEVHFQAIIKRISSSFLFVHRGKHWQWP